MYLKISLTTNYIVNFITVTKWHNLFGHIQKLILIKALIKRTNAKLKLLHHSLLKNIYFTNHFKEKKREMKSGSVEDIHRFKSIIEKVFNFITVITV